MTSKLLRFVLLAALLASAGTTAAYAQLTGQITGTISDASGAVIPGVSVTVINADTGIKWEATSNEVGTYIVPMLQPGNYRINVSADGFKAVSRGGIQLVVGQQATIDFKLELGAVTETVEVVDVAPLLDTGTNAIGGVVSQEKFENLPTKGRNSASFMMLVPGVRISQATLSGPIRESHYQFFSVTGSRPNDNAFYLDGGNNSNAGFNNVNYSTQVESIAEFKVQTNSFSAEHANTAGGVINIVTKNGTNEFHGSLFEYLRNDALAANNFFSNKAGQKMPVLRYNQFGGTFGGPVIKNRTFFFGGIEALRQKIPASGTVTVPTELQKQGDFTQTFAANGQMIRIFDPLTTKEDPGKPGTFLRDQFPGNVIPASRMNQIALNTNSWYPAANQTGNAVTGLNNFYFSTGAPTDKEDYSIRIDHELAQASRLTGRYSWAPITYSTANRFGTLAASGAQTDWQTHRSIVLKLIQTFSPSFFGEFSGGYNSFDYLRQGAGVGFDPTDLGFPSYLAANSAALMFPSIAPAGVVALGTAAVSDQYWDTFEGAANLTKASGRHTLKFGGVYGANRINTLNKNGATGSYSFGAGFTQQNPFVNKNTEGHGYATFLLGYPGGSHATVGQSSSITYKYWGGYIQDDFKITSRLTLNLGVRYDFEHPMTERYNRLVNFDYTTAHTLANSVGAVGGITFPGVDGMPRGAWNPDKNNVSPRFGFAFELNSDTVVRGGYGLFYTRTTGSGMRAAPQYGFICSTPVLGSADGGKTPATSISDPFPNGFCQPTGASEGLSTQLGQGIQILSRGVTYPYNQKWTLDIQRRLPGNVVLDASYVGNRGVHLIGALQYNQLHPDYMSMGTGLTKTVANPYYGLVGQGTLSQPKVTVGQLLRPYPQLLNIQGRLDTYGSSTYHGMLLKLERRFADGFSVLGSYTWSKLIDNVSDLVGFPGEAFSADAVQNFYNLRLERSLAPFDTPHMLNISGVYELPVGKGKALLNRGGAVDKILGGWQVNAIASFMSGKPLKIAGGNSAGAYAGGQRPNWSGQDARLSGDIHDRLDRYFDTSQFTKNDPFTFGNAPRTMPNLRSHGVSNFDISIFKNTQITERFRLQFRAEAFNAFNRVEFAFPNQAINSNAFGQITSQANSPRDIQLALKLLF